MGRQVHQRRGHPRALRVEYKVICDKGFAAYFLIVAEYVRWAKQSGIGVGPGRGSAAGALVAYAMDITTFDPVSYTHLDVYKRQERL